jgi:hypothetical protein
MQSALSRSIVVMLQCKKMLAIRRSEGLRCASQHGDYDRSCFLGRFLPKLGDAARHRHFF